MYQDRASAVNKLTINNYKSTFYLTCIPKLVYARQLCKDCKNTCHTRRVYLFTHFTPDNPIPKTGGE
jgi:hypothetical protein